MKLSTFKSEATDLDWKRVDYLLLVGDELLLGAEEFKYVGTLLMIEGKGQLEIDWQIGAGSAVMWTLCQLVMVKREAEPAGKAFGLSFDLRSYSHL